MDSKELATKVTEILDSKKGIDIEMIDVSEKTTLADYFIIASGNSTTQIKALTDEVEIVENKKLNAIKTMTMTGNAFVLSYESDEQDIIDGLMEMTGKMQKTLDYCRDVVAKRSTFTISQNKVILKRL